DVSKAGHLHTNLSAALPGTFGTFDPSSCVTVNGSCQVTYKVSQFSGPYKISAAVDTDPSVFDNKNLDVEIGGLASLQPAPSYHLTGSFGTTNYPGCPGQILHHPANHFGTVYL